MTEICFLGTGGWIATRKRDNTSLLIRQERGLVLIDCPGSVIQKIKSLNLNPADVDSILITHVHPDHIYGLPSLVHSLMLEEHSIFLYGSKETVDFCQRLLDLFHLREERILCRINFVSLDSGQKFDLLPSLSCTSLRVPHHPSSQAFIFDEKDQEKRFLYSGDTPLHPPLFEKARDIDILIHECSAPERYFKEYPVLYDIHTNAFDLSRLCQKSNVKCLIPCHMFGDLDFDEAEIEQELLENYDGRVIVPHDLMRIEV